MLITFDLDDTLICWQEEVPTEPLKKPWHLFWFKAEPLRQGTRDIFKQLRKEGWEIGIYTTSHRRRTYIKRLFNLHGLRLDLIVNQHQHEKIVSRMKQKKKPSKIPCWVGAKLHVDNSEGVYMEGQKHHFRVLVVDPLDKDWTARIAKEAEKVKNITEQHQ